MKNLKPTRFFCLKRTTIDWKRKVTELNLKIELLLKQLYGRKSERRLDGVGQLLLDLGEEATPEVVSALEEAIRDAERIVEEAEEEKKKRRATRPRKDDRKFPEHLPRYEKVVDLSETQREGLKFIGYDEVETLELIRAELRVRLTKYAKYAHPAGKSQGIISPERPPGWSRVIALTRRSVSKSSPQSTSFTCHFIANRTCLPG